MKDGSHFQGRFDTFLDNAHGLTIQRVVTANEHRDHQPDRRSRLLREGMLSLIDDSVVPIRVSSPALAPVGASDSR
jgi:hypothetical protein